VRLLVGGVLVCAALAAHARPAARDGDEARREYETGARQYELGSYEQALASFARAYDRSRNAALLFNMAACEERLGRPGEAAARLRAYLKERPNASDRVEVEVRVRALEEQAARAGTGEAPRRSPWLWVAIAGAAVVVGAIVLGLAFGVQRDPTPSFGRVQAP
jgi:tetratricopeptide (TPR) repeat protein